MSRVKNQNLIKKDILKKIQFKTGLPYKFINQLTDDFIILFKKIIKEKGVNIKNFGSFNTLLKKERMGRNPKNRVSYKINARKSIQFIVSKKISSKLENL